VREAASYGAAGLAGSLVAALLVHLAIQPGYLASPRRVGIVLFYSLVFTALFMALAYARVYYRAYLERVRAEERMKADLAQAELRALRARIDPHFLFNALNSIAALIAVEPARAEAMTERLAEVFRYTLRGSRRETATLLDELQFVRAYVEIERTRMGERLRFEEQVDPATLTCRLPALLLQPLVENAVRHGAGARGEGGVVRLRAAARNGELVVEVEDDGPGFDPAAPAAGGFGLHSVSERLRMLGPGHAFEVESDPGRGTRVRLRLPVVSDPDR
jgi:LytS/YehU family sensor histidine kinase